VIVQLEHETLPGSRDVLTHVTVLPKPGPAWARRVGGYSLWLAFRFDESSVTILGVMNRSPTPLR
jgi:hypothetical protein